MVDAPGVTDDFLKDKASPYWVEKVEDLPLELRNLPKGSECGASRWLVFPDEQVGIDHQATMAVRSVGTKLEICRADDRAALSTVNAHDCSAIQFSSSLLRSEVALFMDDGYNLSVTYNALGDSAVQDLLKEFLIGMFFHSVPGFTVPESGEQLQIEPKFQDTLNRFLPADETFAVAAQAPARIRNHRWFGKRYEAIPACAMAISPRRLVLASSMSFKSPGRYKKSVTMIPAGSLDRIGLQVGDNGVATIEVGLDKFPASTLRYVCDTAMVRYLENFVGACERLKRKSWEPVQVQELSPVAEPVCVAAADAIPSAQQELLRLTGVDLPEAEAMEALVQIHNFKWLEAERAGFDTWAIIQPENPMRAAAVHWVRKYFGQFNQGRGTGQQIAS